MASESFTRSATKHLFDARESPPEHCLVAHSDGGARGNPGPAGYGVVIKDETGRKIAALSEYLGHQTNNFAEYQGLIAALEYAIKHGPKALKLISDSELLVRQIKGIYKVKNPTLQDLHARAKELIRQLDWFSIGHALREHNQEADRLANEAMDRGMGRGAPRMRRRRRDAGPTSARVRGRGAPRKSGTLRRNFARWYTCAGTGEEVTDEAKVRMARAAHVPVALYSAADVWSWMIFHPSGNLRKISVKRP